ncbi:NAD/FAD-dependent oxidoreductase [Haloprofundus marisrubri]|uniref:NAD/FAD-dependent oxidoreductase n=1 Tax=Haloprofundus marisrubri TaxID=1514971 RepID=A0A0W1R7N4_9EURY|nr:FAD-dependent oxidoreductase [Haloprofundus marisrubri]KTG09443.1 NAD/FAD-dependent oxidoreductase [Haloprofundus marisrubri]
MTRTVGIVGAGAAGVGAAYALDDTDFDVTIFEKSRGVCGRAATRRKHDCRYDHGANYLKDADERTVELVDDLGDDGLVAFDDPVWTFDGDGEIRESDRDPETKYTWEEGITQLAKRLLARTDATVHNQVRVERLQHGDGREHVDEKACGDQWYLTDTDGSKHGPFDALVLTPPAPQTAALLAETKWHSEHLPALREVVGAVHYRTIRSVMLHYPFEVDVPYYGLVNTDREHDIGWLSREECKRGHVPDGESLLVVQMAPHWSEEHYDDPIEETAETVAEKVATLVGDDRLTEFDWTDDQGWRYAQPNSGASEEILRRGESDGLFFAGDWVAGEGRVHLALWNGVEVGERIPETF